MTSTAAERETAVLHLWDAGILRPESLGEQVIDAVLGEGWRPPAQVVTTVAELDALPHGSVVRCNVAGQVALRHRHQGSARLLYGRARGWSSGSGCRPSVRRSCGFGGTE